MIQKEKNSNGLYLQNSVRHCEERNDEAIQISEIGKELRQ